MKFVDYLYERKDELECQIKKLEKRCFDAQVRPMLKELRARYEEVCKTIIMFERET